MILLIAILTIMAVMMMMMMMMITIDLKHGSLPIFISYNKMFFSLQSLAGENRMETTRILATAMVI